MGNRWRLTQRDWNVLVDVLSSLLHSVTLERTQDAPTGKSLLVSKYDCVSLQSVRRSSSMTRSVTPAWQPGLTR